MVQKLHDLEIGKAAEHLVVADLLLSGYRAFLTDQGVPYDVVLEHDRTLLRVQVKSTREARKIPGRALGTGYLYQVRRAGKRGRRVYSDEVFDILALVALDIRVIAYLPLSEKVLQTIYLRPPGYNYHARAERTRTIDQYPIEAVLATLTGRRPVLTPRSPAPHEVAAEQTHLFEMVR
jgi:hypothetical protein